EAEEVGDAGGGGAFALAIGGVRELGLVVDLDIDGEDVADARGALVVEEAARAGPPQRIRPRRLIGRGRGLRHGMLVAAGEARGRADRVHLRWSERAARGVV